MLLMLVSIPLAFSFFQFASQFSCEKVVVISMCPFVNFQINSFNSVHVFSDLFPFLCSFCALFCSSEGINNHDFWAQHIVVREDNSIPQASKKIRFQFKQNLKLKMKLFFKWAKGKQQPPLRRYKSSNFHWTFLTPLLLYCNWIYCNFTYNNLLFFTGYSETFMVTNAKHQQ